MKKILLFAFLLIGTASFGQSKDALKNIKEVTFYGVDYSHVGIIGADESSYKFIETFTKINELMQREYSKYVKPLAKKTKVIDQLPALKNIPNAAQYTMPVTATN